MQDNFERLKAILREMGSVLVAYSGGVDSTFLLKAAHHVLGGRAVGVIASSETYPAAEVESALRLAEELGIRVIGIRTEELSQEAFTRNAPDRCYHCKLELFRKLKQIADEEGLAVLAHGANVDDLGDYRPGQRAAEELGARAPLQEARLTKEMIRALSREMGLPTWDKPSLACLASRFPYGTAITQDALRQVDEAESRLRGLGFRQVRVRHHGDVARVEVGAEEFPRLLDPDARREVVDGIKKAGFLYVTVDIEGYRTGSMNAPLEVSK